MEKIKEEITDYFKYLTGASRDEEITRWKQQSKTAEEESRKLSESLRESRDSKLFRKRKHTDSMSNLMPNASKQALLPNTLKQPNLQTHPPTDLLQALAGLVNTFSKKRTRTATTTTSAPIPTTATTVNKRKGPHQWERLPKEGRSSKRTIKKGKTYRKNRHKHKRIQNNDTNNNYNNIIIDHDNTDPHDTIDTDNTMNDNDDALVILAKQTTLTETQKMYLEKDYNSYQNLNSYQYKLCIQTSEIFCID